MIRVKHLLNLTLAGLPELQYFETDEAREKALTEIGVEAGSPFRGGFWVAVGTLIGAAFGSSLAMRWALKWVSWPGWVENLLPLFAAAAAFFAVLRALHRSGAGGELRAKLLASGVPVCTACGYLLRGLPLTPGRCPECGRAFDDVVRRILTATNAPPEPDQLKA